MPKQITVHTGRAFDRLVNFTDAVTAVAITVLVLPIIGLRAKGAEQTVWSIINDNLGTFLTFAWTFLVVALLWQVHNRIFSRLIGFDTTIFWLNTFWLLLVAFVPWTSVMYGTGIDGTSAGSDPALWSGGEGLGGTGLLYWFNCAAVSFVSSLVVAHALRHPQLIDADAPRVFVNTRLVHMRGAIFGSYFVLIGICTLFIPQIAVWMPLGFFIIAPLVARQQERHE
jgi:uncharacterized membrane protein